MGVANQKFCHRHNYIPPAKFPDKYDRSAFSSVIDLSLEISFQNSAGQSIVFNRGRRFPIRAIAAVRT